MAGLREAIAEGGGVHPFAERLAAERNEGDIAPR